MVSVEEVEDPARPQASTAEQATASGTNASKDTSDAASKDATSFLEQGQKSFAKENWAEAAEHYSHAVEILTNAHGELSIESVDALIAYGKALLRHAIASSGVLGGSNTAPHSTDNSGPAVGEASSSKQPLPSTVPSTDAGPSSAQRANFHFGGDGPEDEEEQANGGPEDAEDAEANDEADESGAANTVEDDLETAFGVLDMARTILSKISDADNDTRMKLANVHELLAEVATESEKFADAAQEYVTSLDILKELLPDHARRLASAHLMCALAYEFIPQSSAEITSEIGKDARTKAVDHAEKAKQVLLLRKSHLVQEEAQAGRNDPASYDKKVSAELEDIEGIFGELEEKIEELKAMPEIAEQTERDKQAMAGLGGVASALPANAPVNNLSTMGLVKKKKPAAAPTANVGGSNGSVDGAGDDPKGKRKAQDIDDVPSPKKVKFADDV